MSEDGLTIWRSGRRTGNGDVKPVLPAVVLVHPKYPHNVGQVVRLASCFGIPQVWYSGTRVALRNSENRLPREERMRRYEDVLLVRHEDPLGAILRAIPDACPVAVELRLDSESLPEFCHPDGVVYDKSLGHYLVAPTMSSPVYVFGPEDGSLPGSILKRCHRFVTIPSFECMNLSTAVGAILYDRVAKMPSNLRPAVRDRGMVV